MNVPRVPNRDLRRHLAARGIGTDVSYPLPLHRQACVGRLAPDRPPTHADTAAAPAPAPPIYPELAPEQPSWVVESIAEGLG